MCLAGTVLFSGCLTPANAVERSLLGIHIYSNVSAVLHKFGNPNYVLNVGQSFNSNSGTVNGGATGQGFGNGPTGGFAGSDSPPGGFAGGLIPSGFNPGEPGQPGALPPLQPAGGPVAAFGQSQGNGEANAQTSASTVVAGEVTLVYQKPSGVTYQFLLSPSGSVLQITSLGYSDALTKTTKAVRFGSSYTQLIRKYGYPENQSESNGVRIVDYSKRAHVAFELVDNSVVGIVVAAID